MTTEQCDKLAFHLCACCANTSVECKYDPNPSIPRPTSLQQRNGALRIERDLLHNLIDYLSTRSGIEAQ